MRKLSFFEISLADSDFKIPAKENKLKDDANKAASLYIKSTDSEHAIDFSHKVFRWGGGLRVYAKLDKAEWGKHVHNWLLGVPKLSDREAIEQGIVHGVGVSFASKHLRILYPDRFATLDSVIERRLGYARNSAGYVRFLSDLNNFKKTNAIKHTIGDIEEAIYIAIKGPSAP